MFNIAQVIATLVTEYRERHGVTAEEINEGQCEDFAKDLKRQVGGEIQDNEMLNRAELDWYHAFLFLDGRYYDSETPNGVEDWRQLPCCQRCGPLI
jgi:hypothetical protein